MKRSVKELREVKNWTQSETAEKLGISVSSYRRWENNFAKLGVTKADRVAKLLSVTLDDISFEEA
jgi:transcriptional regulator with XRE-family HTH domain